MPRIETFWFMFCAFWVCFFGGCAGVATRHDCKTTDAQYTVNESLNNRTNRHNTELMSLRSEMRQAAIDQDKHHMYHLTSHCKLLDRCITLECRLKRVEDRMVIVVPQEMPGRRTIDPSELEPNIPPQKLPILPSDK